MFSGRVRREDTSPISRLEELEQAVIREVRRVAAEARIEVWAHGGETDRSRRAGLALARVRDHLRDLSI